MDYDIESIAHQVDDFLSTMLANHKIDPLILSSVILARLLLANEYVGSDGDFKKLASNMTTVKKNKTSVH